MITLRTLLLFTPMETGQRRKDSAKRGYDYYASQGLGINQPYRLLSQHFTREDGDGATYLNDSYL